MLCGCFPISGEFVTSVQNRGNLLLAIFYILIYSVRKRVRITQGNGAGKALGGWGGSSGLRYNIRSFYAISLDYVVLLRTTKPDGIFIPEM